MTGPLVDPRELIGQWELRRRLVDRVAGLSGWAKGTLTIAADDLVAEEDEDGNALSWHEAARLHWAGRDVAVTRDLRLIVRDGQWWTTFTDHRPFHPWLLDEPVLHPCAADIYRGRLSLDQGGDRLRILWDVTGPTKDFRIFTTHRRA